MDRNEILLTGALIIVVIIGGLLNANRVHDATFTPVVVEERSQEPNKRDPSIESVDANGLTASDALAVGPGKKDINTATVEQLMDVKGIGESLAQEIVKYRGIKGLYRSMKDLDNVSGIGEKRVGLLSEYFEVRIPPTPTQNPLAIPVEESPHLTNAARGVVPGVPGGQVDFGQGRAIPFGVGQAQTAVGLININVASEEDLALLPGIGEVLARRIVEDRYMYGAYSQKTDIMRVNGIGEKTYLKIEPWIETGY